MSQKLWITRDMCELEAKVHQGDAATWSKLARLELEAGRHTMAYRYQEDARKSASHAMYWLDAALMRGLNTPF